ncbi:tape measure protein [Mycobacterium phage ExplosioNervosa]|uniref:tail length tape measure protein n=1 Tax=Mycobacterium phage Pioneer TaxID=1698417 RepID=UPI0006BDD393|nr:tail length tape measure protein [Mycobacterium phage Pioneer]AOT26146.1 tape measure protein [Mycobacterium phage Qobbit]AVI04206.1 tape measure protein [Mycobacterium phage Phonnegut]AZF93506.1 tape measure protein [Mycobacterium phage ExplosioNervosa]QGJ88680.1 tape measure protein [Mycobacterium phage Beemo]ALA07838.1 tape measure protein [Mycobacterium phage Pioneer]
MLATMRAEGKQGVKVDVDSGGGRSVRPGGGSGGSGGNDPGADPGGVDNAIRQSINSLNRWSAAWKEARAGIADAGRAVKLAADGTRNYNAEIRGSVAEMQRERPLLNHTYADIKARIAKMREFTDALKQQQQWMRQGDRTLSANAARWKSWTMAVRDANEHATSAVRKFGASFKALRGGGGEDGGGIFSSIKNLFGDSGDEAEKAGNQFGNAGKKILGLSRGMWMFTGIVAIAAPLIGVIAGILAGLPSLIGAFGAGIAVVALGMDGIKKAAEVFGPVMEQVKAAVSDTFATGLTPVFQQLAGLLTAITPNLQNVATGLVNMANSVTQVVTGVQGMGQIQNILDKTGEFFTGLGPVLATGTQAFLTLANAGANSFGKLLEPLQNFANGFNEMVNRVTSNGVFEGAMSGLSSTLNSLLGLFTRLMESGLQAMGQLGGPLSTFINGLGDAFIALMPALTSISGLLGNVLGTLGTSLAPIIQALTPAFTTLADTLGTLLVGNLQTLGTVLTPVAQLLGGAIKTALDALTPLLPPLIEQFSQLANTMVSQLAPYIPQLATAFGQIVGAVLQLVPVIVSSLIPAFQQMLPAIIQMVPPLTSMMQSLAQMMPVITAIVGVVIKFAGAIMQAGASIASFLLGGLQRIVGVLAEVQAAVAGWVSSWQSGIDTVSNYVGQLPGKIKSWFDDAGSWLIEAGKNVVQGLINGISSMIGAAVSKAKELASGVAGAVKSFLGINSPSRLMTEYGEYTGQGFEVGLDNSQDGIKSKAQEMLEMVKAIFGDASGLTINFNMGGAQQQLQGITDSAKGLRTEMSGLATDVGTNPALGTDTGMSASDTEKKLDQLKMRSRELEIQAKQAKIDGNKELAEQLRMEKEKLALQMDQLKYAKDYGSETTDLNTALGESLGKALGVPGDFAKATVGQFMSDIGISGNGMISKALTEGVKYIFNIGSVDEAMSIKDREESKQALTVVGRQG